MQLFVLGATGGTDRELIRQALNRRHMSLESWESRTPRRHEKAEETISSRDRRAGVVCFLCAGAGALDRSSRSQRTNDEN